MGKTRGLAKIAKAIVKGGQKAVKAVRKAAGGKCAGGACRVVRKACGSCGI